MEWGISVTLKAVLSSAAVFVLYIARHLTNEFICSKFMVEGWVVSPVIEWGTFDLANNYSH